MRAVTTPNFCKVCLETLWIHLLRNVSFIDKVKEHCDSTSSSERSSSVVKTLSLDLLPLADLRKSPIDAKESYTIVWKKDGNVLPEFTNQTRIELQSDHSVGNYTVHVKFSTEEVRLDSPVMENEGSYEVTASCNESI